MRAYIITWKITLDSDSKAGALESALDFMAAGKIRAYVELVHPNKKALKKAK